VGCMHVCGITEDLSEDQVKSLIVAAIEKTSPTGKVVSFLLEENAARGRTARLKLSKPGMAHQACQKLKELGTLSKLGTRAYADLTFNSRPYHERGWCIFEDALAHEPLYIARELGEYP
jgi:hypothetical protein